MMRLMSGVTRSDRLGRIISTGGRQEQTEAIWDVVRNSHDRYRRINQVCYVQLFSLGDGSQCSDHKDA